MNTSLRIISGSWVLPIETPPLRSASVVLNHEKIIEVGCRRDIKKRYPDAEETPLPGVLMPGLVNCHTHFELSNYPSEKENYQKLCFTDWVRSLLQSRVNSPTTSESIKQKIVPALSLMKESGVAVCVDIGNEIIAELYSPDSKHHPKIVRLLEFFGAKEKAVAQAIKQIKEVEPSIQVTPHGCYSTGTELLHVLKNRCRKRKHLFSIHAAEAAAEIEFIRYKTGELADFVKERGGLQDAAFKSSSGQYNGVIDYLFQMELMDEYTLLVHCVHVSEEDLALIKKTGSKICVCPRSNDYLGVGIAPVTKMVEMGLEPGIGTDSIASNPELDIWNEMKLLYSQHPRLHSETILKMATIWGAKAIGFGDLLGSFRPGKKSRLLHLNSDDLKNAKDGNGIIETLVCGGKPGKIDWVS